MQPNFIKAVILVLGGFSILFGVSALGLGTLWLLPKSIGSGDAFSIVFAVLGILLGAYFVQVGYLVWFRWSPLAVRHVIGTLAFLLVGVLGHLDHHITLQPEWSPLWYLGSFLVVYLLYRLTVAYCSRLLFPASLPAIVPQTHRT